MPKVEPILLALQKAGVNALIKLAHFVQSVLLPAFETLSAWWKSEGGKAFADMISKLGKAFLGMFGIVATGKKTMGQLVQEKLLKFLQFLTKAFTWIGNNAKWLVPTIVTLAVALGGLLIALEVAAAIAAIANPVGLIITGIALLAAGIVIVYQNWDKLKEMFPQTTAIIEQFIAGFKASFMLGFDFVIAIWKTLVALFTGDFSGVGEAWTKVWNDAVVLFQWWSDTIVAIAKWLWQWLVGQWNLTVEQYKEAWGKACEFFTDAWKKFTKWITDFKVPAWLQKIAGGAGSLITGAGHLVGEAYRGITGGGGGGGGGGGAGATAAAVAGGPSPAMANVALPPEAAAKVAAERSEMIADLMRPEMRNLVSATLSTEEGSAFGQKNVLEAMVNRAVEYKRLGQYHGMEAMIKGGFYGPYNRGETSAVMAKGLSDARSQQVAGIIQEMSSRNVLRGMTDQGMVNEIKGYKENIGGRVLRLHGW